MSTQEGNSTSIANGESFRGFKHDATDVDINTTEHPAADEPNTAVYVYSRTFQDGDDDEHVCNTLRADDASENESVLDDMERTPPVTHSGKEEKSPCSIIISPSISPTTPTTDKSNTSHTKNADKGERKIHFVFSDKKDEDNYAVSDPSNNGRLSSSNSLNVSGETQTISSLSDPRLKDKKRVQWQTSHAVEANEPRPLTDGTYSNPSLRCVNVEPVVQTEQLPLPFNCGSPVENKEIKEPENNPSAPNGHSIILSTGGKENEPVLPTNGNTRPEDRAESLERLADTVNKHTARGTDQSPSNPLARRRPLSASGVPTTAVGRSGTEGLSPAVRPSSAAAVLSHHRPCSLPRNLCWGEQQPTRPQQQQHRDLPPEKTKTDEEAGKGILVTYADQKTEALRVKENGAGSTADLTKQRPYTPVIKSPYDKFRRTPSAKSRRPFSSPSLRQKTSLAMGPRRPWDLHFSKEELERVLPRRNFFNSHNKALKEAGFDVDDGSARPRRRRLFNFHHEDDDDNDEKSKQPGPPVIKEPGDGQGRNGGRDDAEKGDAFPETAVNMLSVQDRVGKRRKSIPPPVVECKPLQLYLSYVRDNPAEYRQMVARSATTGAAAALHRSSVPADNCHTARLVNMGQIFQERQSGGLRADEVLRAAYAINPRAADPNRFAAKPQRDRSPLLQGLLSTRKQSTIPSLARKESSVPSLSGVSVTGGAGAGIGGDEGSSKGTNSGQRSPKPGSEDRPRLEATPEQRVAIEHLPEVDKRRVKAEEWARTVTTEQLMRAKLHVLKELGEEERELSQWWTAFRTCFYLRSRIKE